MISARSDRRTRRIPTSAAWTRGASHRKSRTQPPRRPGTRHAYLHLWPECVLERWQALSSTLFRVNRGGLAPDTRLPWTVTPRLPALPAGFNIALKLESGDCLFCLPDPDSQIPLPNRFPFTFQAPRACFRKVNNSAAGIVVGSTTIAERSVSQSRH